MLQKHIDKLQKLGFTGDLDSIRPVLEMRAYHNTYDTFSAVVTDRSYAVLNIPQCYDEETEQFLFEKVAQLLYISHKAIDSEQNYDLSAVMTDPPTPRHDLQFAFRSALTEEQIAAEFMSILDFAVEKGEELQQKMDTDRKKLRLAQIVQRIKAIRVFVEAGSTSYVYCEKSYDWLE